MGGPVERLPAEFVMWKLKVRPRGPWDCAPRAP